jgi:hypothetical protein
MPVQLDIAGNFAKGADAMIKGRLARQIERDNDLTLADKADKLGGRRDAIRQVEDLYGMQPYDFDQFGSFQTNQDPMLTKLQNWWMQRRSLRGNGRSAQPPTDYAGGVATAPIAGDEFVYKDGGAIPRRMAEGGDVVDENEMIRRRAAANRARTPGSVMNATETAIPAAPGMLERGAGLLRRGVNAAGRVAALPALVSTAIDTANTPTEDYRKRFGMETNDPSLLGDLGVRTLGAASDLGNALTFGQAGKLYRDKQQPAAAIPTPAQEAAQPSPPPATPTTPDEAIAVKAKADGAKMLQQAEAQSAPPGAIDFSKVNVPPSEIPNMPVKDWVQYRARYVRDAMLQGKTGQEAQAEVTKMQQQGFLDYANQALMHLQGGNPLAAASSLRAAYQYFPNGSDVKIGATKGKDGNPVLVGMGHNEDTGAPIGHPMVINPERLSVMIQNFADPKAFTAWTKDWRDEEFKNREYQEIKKPEAQGRLDYQNRMATAAERQASAAELRATRTGAGGGMKQADYDRAYAQFMKSQELTSLQDPEKAQHLASVMAMTYAKSPPGTPYPTVLNLVMMAAKQGKLPLLERQLAGMAQPAPAEEADTGDE